MFDFEQWDYKSVDFEKKYLDCLGLEGFDFCGTDDRWSSMWENGRGGKDQQK